MDCNANNFRFNSEVLPVIVECVLLCARQRIALQGHQQDNIDFAYPATRNEGNFIAILKYWKLLLIRFGIFIVAVFTVVHIFLLWLMRLLHMVKKYYLFGYDF